MLNNLTNFFNLIDKRRLKTTPELSDLIALGTLDKKYTGGYKPTFITWEDLIGAIGGAGADNQQISQTVLPNGDVQIDLTGDNPSSFILDQRERNHANSLFVDRVYGNDGTGARERSDKPFLTYNAARAAALAGDRIVLRPGSYGNLILKDQVDIEDIDNLI